MKEEDVDPLGGIPTTPYEAKQSLLAKEPSSSDSGRAFPATQKGKGEEVYHTSQRRFGPSHLRSGASFYDSGSVNSVLFQRAITDDLVVRTELPTTLDERRQTLSQFGGFTPRIDKRKGKDSGKTKSTESQRAGESPPKLDYSSTHAATLFPRPANDSVDFTELFWGDVYHPGSLVFRKRRFALHLVLLLFLPVVYALARIAEMAKKTETEAKGKENRFSIISLRTVLTFILSLTYNVCLWELFVWLCVQPTLVGNFHHSRLILWLILHVLFAFIEAWSGNVHQNFHAGTHQLEEKMRGLVLTLLVRQATNDVDFHGTQARTNNVTQFFNFLLHTGKQKVSRLKKYAFRLVLPLVVSFVIALTDVILSRPQLQEAGIKHAIPLSSALFFFQFGLLFFFLNSLGQGVDGLDVLRQASLLLRDTVEPLSNTTYYLNISVERNLHSWLALRSSFLVRIYQQRETVDKLLFLLVGVILPITGLLAYFVFFDSNNLPVLIFVAILLVILLVYFLRFANLLTTLHQECNSLTTLHIVRINLSAFICSPKAQENEDMKKNAESMLAFIDNALLSYSAFAERKRIPAVMGIIMDAKTSLNTKRLLGLLLTGVTTFLLKKLSA
jgi:hypothetical protein